MSEENKENLTPEDITPQDLTPENTTPENTAPEDTKSTENTASGENEQEAEKEPFNLGKEIFEWVYTIAIALAIALVIKAFLFDVVKVDGSSMYPTLVDNDRLIVTKLNYEPKQGDIIILDSRYKEREEYFEQQEAAEGREYSSLEKYFKTQFSVPSDYKKKYYVKRIIALPGQTVSLENNKVYVDGEPLEEEYYQGETFSIDTRVHYPVTVEEGMVFVMGDNRAHSEDSRSSRLGQVPFEAILGKSQFRIFPFTSIGVTK